MSEPLIFIVTDEKSCYIRGEETFLLGHELIMKKYVEREGFVNPGIAIEKSGALPFMIVLDAPSIGRLAGRLISMMQVKDHIRTQDFPSFKATTGPYSTKICLKVEDGPSHHFWFENPFFFKGLKVLHPNLFDFKVPTR